MDRSAMKTIIRKKSNVYWRIKDKDPLSMPLSKTSERMYGLMILMEMNTKEKATIAHR
jgi:hypothetical protein